LCGALSGLAAIQRSLSKLHYLRRHCTTDDGKERKMAGHVCFGELARFIRLSKFKEAYYAMIGSYLDESFDMRRSGLFVVGGFMARGTPIVELDWAWGDLCKRPDIPRGSPKTGQLGSPQNRPVETVI
jgi:hypothetical protein